MDSETTRTRKLVIIDAIQKELDAIEDNPEMVYLASLKVALRHLKQRKVD